MLDPPSKFLRSIKKYIRDDTADTDAYISGRDSICIYPNLHGFWFVFHKCWKRGRAKKDRGEIGGRGIGNTCTRCDAIDNNRSIA